MSKLIFPDTLSVGDRAIILSPSGQIDSKYIDGAKTILENWGLQVCTGMYAYNQYGRFGGTVSQRLQDLQEALDDCTTKLIFCSRGGYGAVHLLDKLNLKKAQEYPKWLVGYSDITALHQLLLQAGIVSIHAPMAKHLCEHPNDYSSTALKQVLFSGRYQYSISSHSLNTIGRSRGKLFGGNLAVLTSLCGTPFLKAPKGGILFIEDIAEKPYKIDRMLWQLKLSGVLDNLSGLIIGQFTDCEEDPSMPASIYQSIKEMTLEYDYPVIFDFPLGHVENNYPLLHGAEHELDATQNIVTLKNI